MLYVFVPTETTVTSEQTRGAKVDNPVEAAILNGRSCSGEVVAVTRTDNWQESVPVAPGSVTSHAKQQLDRSKSGVAVFFKLDAGVTVEIYSMPDSWDSDAPLNQLLRRKGLSPSSLDGIIGESYPLVYDRYRWVLESEQSEQTSQPFYSEFMGRYVKVAALTLLTVPVWFLGAIPGLAATSAAAAMFFLMVIQDYQLDNYQSGDTR